MDKDTQTDLSVLSQPLFSIDQFCGDPESVSFYTSFVSYDHFMYVFHCLGHAAYHLNYKSRTLEPRDEFFLLMMKLRLNREDHVTIISV